MGVAAVCDPGDRESARTAEGRTDGLASVAEVLRSASTVSNCPTQTTYDNRPRPQWIVRRGLILPELRHIWGAAGEHFVDDEELLLRWVEGDIPHRERAAILEHMADCPRCREEIAEWYLENHESHIG